MSHIDPSQFLLNLTDTIQSALNAVQQLQPYEQQLRDIRDHSHLLARQECVISYLVAQVREYRRKYGILPENSAIDCEYFETELYGDIFRGRMS